MPSRIPVLIIDSWIWQAEFGLARKSSVTVVGVETQRSGNGSKAWWSGSGFGKIAIACQQIDKTIIVIMRERGNTGSVAIVNIRPGTDIRERKTTIIGEQMILRQIFDVLEM